MLEISRFDAMHAAIVQAHTIDDVKGIRDQAEALRQYARQSRLSIEDINRIAEIKLRAERRGGELVAEIERWQGRRTDLEETSGHDGPKLTLRDQVEEAGLSMTTAKRWQMLSELPEQIFDRQIAETVSAGGELTTSAMLRTVQEYRRERTRAGMSAPGAFPVGRFRVFYADPPWQYGNNGVKSIDDNYGTAERHYPTMSLAELCAMGEQVGPAAMPDSVLWLWTTAPLLPEALAVISAWGFTYKTHYIWHKMRHNFGHYSSVRHELLMVATRGSCLPDVEIKLPSVVEIERTPAHSAKPEEFRQMIDQLYPYGPRLELFRRGDAPAGWHVWGNQAEGG